MSTESDRFDTFIDRYTDPRCCDLEERPKVVKAFRSLCQHLPDEVLFDRGPGICFFAPAPWWRGICTVLMRGAPDSDDALIYLAPSLESELEPRADVDFTVAHEFAHAFLRHHMPGNNTLTEEEVEKGYPHFDAEAAADQLVEEWGFTVPACRKTKNTNLSPPL